MEIDCMEEEDIAALLRQLLVDYRRYHLRQQGQYDATEEEDMHKRARLAWDTLRAAFGTRAECTEAFLGDRNNTSDEVQRHVLAWKAELIWPENFNVSGTVIRARTTDDCIRQAEQFFEGHFWPFIKVIR